MKARTLFLVAGMIIGIGCGYTTRNALYTGESTLYIKPVVNKINITSENRAYSKYRTYPLLIERKLTSHLIDRFSLDGNFKIGSQDAAEYVLEVQITDYDKDSLRYNNNDEVEEQRLWLKTHYKLYHKGKVIEEKDITGDTTYFLTGPYRKSENSAQMDLVKDTARRITDSITERW